MKTFSFDKYITQKPSIHKFLLSLLLTSKYKTWLIECPLRILSELQIICILLSFPYDVVPSNQTDTFGVFMEKISRYISFSKLFDFEQGSGFVTISFIVVTIYTLFSTIFYLSMVRMYSIKRLPSYYVIVYWVNIALAHFSVCFHFISQFALTMLFKASKKSITILGFSGSGVFIGFAVSFLLLNMPNTYFSSNFSYEPIKSGYKGAMRKNTLAFFGVCFKLLDSILAITITDLTLQMWLRLSLMIIAMSLRLRNCLVTFPYFYYDAMKMFLRLYFIEFALMLSNIIAIILRYSGESNSFIGTYTGIILMVFFIKISDMTLQRVIYNSSLQPLGGIKTKSNFYKKLFAIEYILQNCLLDRRFDDRRKRKQIEYMAYGIVKSHKIHCPHIMCGCRLFLKDRSADLHESMSHAEEENLLQDFIVNFIKDFIQEMVNLMPTRSEIKILLANFLVINKKGSDATAITLIHNSKLDNKSTEWEVIGMNLLKKIENVSLEKSESTVNIKELVDYHNLAGEMRKKIESNIKKYLEFWEIYNEPEPLIKRLHEISIAVNKEAERIQTIWGLISTKYSRLSHQDYLLYGLFQSLARSAPSSGEKALHKYFNLYAILSAKQSKESFISNENLHETTNIVIYISMAKENLGEVLFSTANIEATLEYSLPDLLNKNVNMLMSPFFQEKHQSILMDHIERSRTSNFGKNRYIFAKKKNGHIVPMCLYVAAFPYMQNHLLYVGILRPISSFDDYIIVLPDGAIDSFSENFGKKLGLEAHSNKKYNLKIICPQLDRLHRAFNFMLRGQVEQLKQFRVGLNKTKKRQVNISSGLKSANSTFQSLKDVVNSVVRNKTSENPRSKPQDNPTVKKSDDLNGKLTGEKELDDDTHEKETPGDNGQEDWKQLYEQFTSVGVPMYFKPNKKKPETNHNDELDVVEYNTIISEDYICGSSIRILKLQSFLSDTDSDEEGILVGNFTTSGDLSSPKFRKSDHFTQDDIELQEVTDENMEVPRDFGTSKICATLGFKNPFPENPKETTEEESTRLQKRQLRIIVPEEARRVVFTQQLVEGEGKFDSPKLEVFQKTQKAVRKSVMLHHAISRKTKVSLDSKDQKEATKMAPDPKNDLQVFFKQHQILKNPNDELDRSSVSSAAMTSQINSKLEAAIYTKEPDVILKLVNVLIFLFAVGSIALMASYLLFTNSNLSGIKDNVHILRAAYSRLYSMLEISKKARMINIIESGLVPRERHTNDYSVTSLSILNDLCGELSSYNNYVRQTIYKVDTDLQARFYESIEIIDVINNNQRSMNIFDASEEIVNAGFRLSNLLPEKPKYNDSNLYFILNNTLNDLVVKNEEVTDILTDDNDLRLNKIQLFNLVLLVIITSISVLIFILILRNEISFIVRKERFLDALLRINHDHLDEALGLIKGLYASLLESNKQDTFMDKINNQHQQSKANQSSDMKRAKNFKAKTANQNGMNTSLYINIVVASFMLLVFTLTFCFLEVALSSYDVAIDHSMDRIVGTHSNLVKMDLVFTSLYEYVVENRSTYVKFVPIQVEWEQMYFELTQINDYFNRFDDQDGEYNSKVRTILEGDLCSIIFADRPCYAEAAGIGAKGLTGMISFMLKAFREVKDFYDHSGKTKQDQILALTFKDLINAEVGYEVYVATTFLKMDEVLIEIFHLKVDDFFGWLVMIMVITGLLFAILIKWVWLPLLVRMEAERNNFRGLLKLIPFNVILGNKVLKNHLIRTSRRILGSVKNRI